MGRALGGTLAVAALLLAACGTDTSPTSASDATTSPSPETSETSPGTPSASPSDSPSESPSASAESPSPAPAPDGPPFPESTDPQTAEPSGEWDLQLVDVRVGEHDGFDRVVLELSGTATPGWGVAWSDEAVAEGSGDVVPLEGDHVLTISASGTAMPEPGSFEVPARLGPAGAVAEVQVNGWFEGYTQVFAGVEGDERPFRVFTLSDPPRLVVDIAD
ncbi:AMIN-like domain-containing (lipo)protein [Nocardioides sp. P5_E3]